MPRQRLGLRLSSAAFGELGTCPTVLIAPRSRLPLALKAVSQYPPSDGRVRSNPGLGSHHSPIVMETQRICPRCFKPLAPDMPLGPCPECQLKESRTSPPPGPTVRILGF